MESVNPNSWGHWGEPHTQTAQSEVVQVSELDAQFAAEHGGLGHTGYGDEFATPSGDGAEHFFALQAAARQAAEVRRLALAGVQRSFEVR